jgi:hypothetical protein
MKFSFLSMRHLPTSRRDIGCISTPTTPFMEELQDRSHQPSAHGGGGRKVHLRHIFRAFPSHAPGRYRV